jgi:hypothetical protein
MTNDEQTFAIRKDRINTRQPDFAAYIIQSRDFSSKKVVNCNILFTCMYYIIIINIIYIILLLFAILFAHVRFSSNAVELCGTHNFTKKPSIYIILDVLESFH